MRWWRSLSLALLLCSASVFAFRPVTARAEWVNGGASSYSYCVNTTNIGTGSLKVSPLYDAVGSYSYSSPIRADLYYKIGSNWYGQAWSTVPANCCLVRMASFGGGNLSQGRRIEINCPATVKIGYTANTEPTGSTSYNSTVLACTDFRYYVSDGENANKTRVYPDSNGVLTMPIDAQYVFVTCNVPFSISGVKFWNLYSSAEMFSVAYERPEDQDTVSAIDDQTQQMMDTTGSDTVTPDVTDQYSQDIQGLDLFQLVGTTADNLAQTVTTQETDTTVHFPGMSLSGFTLPAVDVDPTSYMPSIMPTVKLVLTFLFCSAFLAHIIELLHAIFGIWEYGAGAESFGMGSFTPGPRPVSWSPDYSIDEDLGF